MFTGIVEVVGRVRSLEVGRLVLDIGREAWPDLLRIGESVAVNGCCLTVTESATSVSFDLSPETLARTSLGDLRQGSLVNIERAMRADGRFGGHIVQGHVDGTGRVVSITPSGNSMIYRFEVPADGIRYLIEKGSITIDGISLTVVKPKENLFDVWVIPHTIESTNLAAREFGDRVNLEYDVIAKYVERLVPRAGPN